MTPATVTAEVRALADEGVIQVRLDDRSGGRVVGAIPFNKASGHTGPGEWMEVTTRLHGVSGVHREDAVRVGIHNQLLREGAIHQRPGDANYERLRVLY